MALVSCLVYGDVWVRVIHLGTVQTCVLSGSIEPCIPFSSSLHTLLLRTCVMVNVSNETPISESLSCRRRSTLHLLMTATPICRSEPRNKGTFIAIHK